MKNVLYLSISAILAILMVGCDSSDEPSTTIDPAAAAQRVRQADDILYPRLALLINSGGQDTSAFNFSTANALYREALALNPANSQAHFGVAVTGMLALLGDPAFRKLPASSNLLVPAVETGLKGRGLSARASSDILKFAETTRDRIEGLARSTLTTDYREFPPGKFLTDTTDAPPSHYQDLIETKVLPVLNDAVTNLIEVSLDPDFAVYITPQQLGGNITDSIRIDLTEVHLLLAVCQVLVGGGSMAVAYDIDYDSHSQSAVMDAWDVGSPFLAFRPGGAQRMHDAKVNFVGATNSIQNGVVYLSNETPHAGVDLIPHDPADNGVLLQIYAVMDSLEMLLTGPYQITADFNNDQTPDVVTVNLYNFFENAVPNYKMKLPAYSVSTVSGGDGTYDAVLTWDAMSFNEWIFPDPTFNGLFPGMTDAFLKALLGLDASGWTPYILIEG